MKTSYLKTQITTASLNFNMRTNIPEQILQILAADTHCRSISNIARTSRTTHCSPQTLPEQIVQITALPAKLFRCHRKTSGLQRLFSRYQLLIPIWNRENHWQNG